MTITVTPELLAGTLNGIQNLFASLAEAAKKDGYEICRDSWHNPDSGATYLCRLEKDHSGDYHVDVFVASVGSGVTTPEGEVSRHFGAISVWEKADDG